MYLYWCFNFINKRNEDKNKNNNNNKKKII